MSHFQNALNAEYAKMRDAGASHQEAMERLRIASANAVKTALADILAETLPGAERTAPAETSGLITEQNKAPSANAGEK